ncbi:MAG: choice-of-anchor J domain-containing protein [Taibaiella sp.]|nr:choice-of-anchor J domain-containing protein [Taibaiella sp.]
MKLLLSLIISLSSVYTGIAQVTSLNENFDASCATTGTNYPLYWSQYNIIPPITALAWSCAPLGGRFGTPGMACNSYFSGIHYLDTAWLFTPILNLSGNLDHIYLRFDSKYEFSAARLKVLVSRNYVKNTRPDTPGVDWTDLTPTLAPVISNDDSTDWVTHFVDLTPFKNSPMMVAFRYTSTTSAGGLWTLDNIMTTPWGLNVDELNTKTIPICVLGVSTGNMLSLSFTSAVAGSYKLSIIDNFGREVHTETVNAKSGTQTLNITNLDLHSGLYCIRLSNGLTNGICKTIIQ